MLSKCLWHLHLLPQAWLLTTLLGEASDSTAVEREMQSSSQSREWEPELSSERDIYTIHKPLHHYPGSGHITEEEVDRMWKPEDGKALGAVFRTWHGYYNQELIEAVIAYTRPGPSKSQHRPGRWSPGPTPHWGATVVAPTSSFPMLQQMAPCHAHMGSTGLHGLLKKERERGKTKLKRAVLESM